MAIHAHESEKLEKNSVVLLMKSMDSGLHILPNINYPICGRLIGILHGFLFNEKWHQLGRIFFMKLHTIWYHDLLLLFLSNLGNYFSPRYRHLIFADKISLSNFPLRILFTINYCFSQKCFFLKNIVKNYKEKEDLVWTKTSETPVPEVLVRYLIRHFWLTAVIAWTVQLSQSTFTGFSSAQTMSGKWVLPA